VLVSSKLEASTVDDDENVLMKGGGEGGWEGEHK